MKFTFGLLFCLSFLAGCKPNKVQPHVAVCMPQHKAQSNLADSKSNKVQVPGMETTSKVTFNITSNMATFGTDKKMAECALNISLTKYSRVPTILLLHGRKNGMKMSRK